MAIRLRTINGTTVALCAAETDEAPGDTYLDDAQHYALSVKYWQDYQGETITYSAPDLWAVMESQKIRDANETLDKWLALHEKP